MAIRYWMISNRDVKGRDRELGRQRSELSYWVSTGRRPIDDLGGWKRLAKPQEFRDALASAASAFPAIPESRHEDQKHVTLFVHGYNSSWADAARSYEKLCRALFDGSNGLGICILFTWPSDASVAAYLPDRIDAERSAPDLAEILSSLYDWLLIRQSAAAAHPSQLCRAKTSVIAHSMGNYLLQRAMQHVWKRKNEPLLVSLVNQLIMVAADVDNDLFKSGQLIEKGDGDAIANLTYRVTALYSGRDQVLGMSAGLKHFGKRRLGRSGLDRTFPVPDNVWDADCSGLFPNNEKNIHSAYFHTQRVCELMRQILRGVDRRVLRSSGVAPPGTDLR